MKLTVRGFTKATLKKYKDVKDSPLCAISPENQAELRICGGEMTINDSSARVIEGSSNEFIGMTKTLRDNLGVENGQDVEVSLEDSILKIS